MRMLLSLVLALVIAVPTLAQNGVAETEGHTYGGKVSDAVEPVHISEAVKENMVDKPIVVTAEVVDVCSAKGCWLTLKDNDSEVRVTFKDYGFFVPSTLKGRMVKLQGVLRQEVTSEADRRHYAEDAGASDEEIAAITGDVTEYTFEATGVKGE